MHSSNISRILEILRNMSACLIGCGIGEKDTLYNLLEQVLKTASCPIVVDADGINNLCGRIEILHQDDIIVTEQPHETLYNERRKEASLAEGEYSPA